MGLKIEKSGLPPMKVLILKKLHILRPAIEYMQLISNPKKVSLPIIVSVQRCSKLIPCAFLFEIC